MGIVGLGKACELARVELEARQDTYAQTRDIIGIAAVNIVFVYRELII